MPRRTSLLRGGQTHDARSAHHYPGLHPDMALWSRVADADEPRGVARGGGAGNRLRAMAAWEQRALSGGPPGGTGEAGDTRDAAGADLPPGRTRPNTFCRAAAW